MASSKLARQRFRKGTRIPTVKQELDFFPANILHPVGLALRAEVKAPRWGRRKCSLAAPVSGALLLGLRCVAFCLAAKTRDDVRTAEQGAIDPPS